MNNPDNTLRTVNAILGAGIMNLNINYDEEDAEFFDKIITAKIEEVPQVFFDILSTVIKECPDEMKKMTVCELLQFFTED